MKTINYKGGYKYQLTAGHEEGLPKPLNSYSVITDYVKIANGKLSIRKGYAWDGPSGPTIDTKNFMRGSLVHDALYQLMRAGELPQSCRAEADRLLYVMCREDGMSWIRAQVVWAAVTLFGAKSASVDQRKEVVSAP